ncbi:hypothetical protein PHMEG_00015511 [Phytophthora megakarya]|uniref:Retrotransposon gag domain-containing protein n=1 Tax=Phytophthora megakarya TaxID=4795 RepID=A0A225W198_9STRA|nr:hypothetical protein PHMEG_00015511 [Phytophthora megakarya]
MTRSENMQKEAGRDGSASGEPVRSSRRVHGLLPEEHRTLDEVERDNRKRNATLRKTAQEARDASSSGESEAESADSDAHQASLAKDSKDGSTGASEADSRMPDLEDDSQVESSESSDRSEDSGSDQPEVEESDEESVVEIMVKTEPSAEDRVTDSPQRPNEAEIVEEKIDVKVERPLSTVQEEAVSEDMEMSLALTETSPPEVLLADITQAGVQMTEDQAKFYVALQCRRWKEAPAGRTVPPGIRLVLGSPTLRVRRNTFGLALDLTGLMIPIGRLSPVQCVAIIQTLLAESGFEFQNVIPVWPEARISKVHSELIQLVCDDLQRLLSVELLETTQLALTAIHEVKDSMAQMQKTKETPMAAMSALALREAGNMDVKKEQEFLLNDARQQVSGSQSPEIPQAETGHSAQNILESRFADYQLRAETHMEALRRQHLDEMAAFEMDSQTLRLERDQEREANKTTATTTAVKTEATTDVRKAPVEGKPRKRSTRKPHQGRKELPKDDLKKKSAPPSHPAGKHGPPDDEPSDDDNDSDQESRDSDSDSSSLEDLASGTQARATGQGTIMFNRMVNITALEDFDEKQPLAVRTLLLETFQSLTLMGRWSDHAKVYYCKLKLSSAVGDWRGNLDVSVRRSWKRYVKASREEFCKAKTPDSEYYYTTFQRKSETPREFYYTLNKIAGKADIDIKSTDIARNRHLKVFIKKLKDIQLRSTLQGQRVRSLKDLEHILKQHEEIWWSDDPEAHPLKSNYRKADGAFGIRQRQKNHNRAYNVNEDEVCASDHEQQVLFDQATHQKVSFGESVSDKDVD